MVNQNILILRPKFNIFWAIFIRLFLTFNTSAIPWLAFALAQSTSSVSYNGCGSIIVPFFIILFPNSSILWAIKYLFISLEFEIFIN
jgi:hypothetical protein